MGATLRELAFAPAATFALADLAGLYTRAFAGYAYPVTVSPEQLARRVDAEQIDLERSPVLLAAGEPAGVALLGLRGAEACCCGLGIAPPHRGRGYAHTLVAEHLRLAREAGARRLTLMVLAENLGALYTYLRAGMRIWRNLHWLEWCGPAPAQRRGQAARAEAAALLGHYAAFPRAAPFWQRDLATLRCLSGLEGWALPAPAQPAAYALVAPEGPGAGQILDLAAHEPARLAQLIAALQAHYSALTINEPAESPAIPALSAAGFSATLLRHELAVEL